MPGRSPVHHGSRHDSLADRFWPKVEKSDGCWLWRGVRQPDGYGYVVVRGQRKRAHRVAWELQNGRQVPDGMVVCHSCDNPSCVRPDHLFTGTQADNRADCVAKGRAFLCRPNPGEKHPFRKLTAAQVRDIYARTRSGARIGRALAREYGVSIEAIDRIRYGKGWRSVLDVVELDQVAK